MNSEPRDAREIAELWGWQTEGYLTGSYMTPLPPTDRYPLALRSAGKYGSLLMPPYVVGAPWPTGEGSWQMELMICDAEGWRAGYDHSAEGCTGDCLYADEPESLPPEWREPVAKAVKEVRSRWPDVVLRPPPPDTVPRVPKT